MTQLSALVESFFNERLSLERSTSFHTQQAYAYSFELLLVFAAEKRKCTPSSLSVEDIDAPLVSTFLVHLETDRDNCPITRNARLAAIKTFMRYVEYRIPSALEQVRQVLAIPQKKTNTRLIAHLSKEEIDALTNALDETSLSCIRDRAMIHLCLCTGLRISELTGLRIDDFKTQPNPTMLIRGKGRKERILPLWKETANAINEWLAVRGETKSPELFVNNRGKSMTRWGFQYILTKYVRKAAKSCPTLADKKVTPHVLRHTCAMIVLQATKDIRKVSLWLGHESMQSTEKYLHAEMSEKLEMLNEIIPPHLKNGKFTPPDRLMSLLKSGILCRVKKDSNVNMSD